MRVARLRLRVAPRSAASLAALAGYSAIAFVYFGVRLLVEPGSHFLGYGYDPRSFIWCFGWWPYAILHWQNPFVSHALWAPSGVNLVWTTSIPGLALLFAPLTLLVGPVVSFNVATLLLPALAAWTAFLLCRALTRGLWPALVGGYLFGFSSYVLGQEEGHTHMSAVFLVPLVVLVVVRFVRGELGARGLVVRLGPLLGLELLFSTELSFTLALALAVSLLLALVLLPARRRALVALLAPLAGAYALAALLTAPFVYYAVSGFQSGPVQPPPGGYVTDLLNFAIPTKLALVSLGWASSISNSFPGNDAERGAYLGLPVLLICALYAPRARRSGGARLLLAALALAVLATLGGRLSIDGHAAIRLPWALVEHLPLFDDVLPERLALYVTLLGAVIVALWTAAQPSGYLRYLLPALALLALVPNPAAGVWASSYTVPLFFTDSAYRDCLDPDENVLPIPLSAASPVMLWQAVDDFRFRMAAGNIATTPPVAFSSPFAVAEVADGYPIAPSQANELATYIRLKHVTSVILDATQAASWVGTLDRLATPDYIGGVVLYHLSAAAPSCAGA